MASQQAPLHLVKHEIGEALEVVESSLKTYHQSPEEHELLNRSIHYLHEVHGCLQMVELYGAALLVAEAESLARAMAEGATLSPDEAYTALVGAVMRIPVYLDLIEKGQEDRPMMLLPIINDLRDMRQEKPIPKSALFSPNLETVEHFVHRDTDPTCGEAEKELVGKLRRIYLVGLLGVMQDKKVERSLSHLQQVLTDLDSLSGSKPLGQFWWIVRAVVAGMQESTIKPDVTLKVLLGRVDREIKRLIQDGVEALDVAPPDTIRNKLLYYVAHCSSQLPIIKEVKQAFSLDDALLSEAGEDAWVAASTPDSGTLEQVGMVLKDEILKVKEALDIFVRTEERDINELLIHQETLTKTLDTLNMLGLSSAYSVLDEKLKILKQITSKEVPPEDNYLFEVATALLYVESTLDSMHELMSHDQQELPKGSFSSEGQVAALSHIKAAEKTILKEARLEINKMKTCFDEFLKEYQHAKLAHVPDLIHAICANLKVLGFERPAAILAECLKFIEEKILNDSAKPDETTIVNLADVISSVEYYLESRESDRPFEAMLDKAEEGLVALKS